MATGQGRKANDRRRVKPMRVVETPNNGSGSKMRGFRISRSTEFRTGINSGKNGRA